ncbi:MAG: hypothetical protein U0800_00655 [Isosphaeraceae bacterium]
MLGVYHEHGIRFEYPPTWNLEEDRDGPVTTVALHAPSGMAFALIRLDEDGPAPADLAEEALDAMRDEYPGLESAPARESINGHDAVGHDVSFFSFDMTNACTIRSFRTPRHTVLLFGQWSELDAEETEEAMKALRGTIEDRDS